MCAPSRVGAIEPVGMTNASTTKARKMNARMNATRIDSIVSLTLLSFWEVDLEGFFGRRPRLWAALGGAERCSWEWAAATAASCGGECYSMTRGSCRGRAGSRPLGSRCDDCCAAASIVSWFMAAHRDRRLHLADHRLELRTW
jgi:hypothetical protein